MAEDLIRMFVGLVVFIIKRGDLKELVLWKVTPGISGQCVRMNCLL